MAKRRSSRTSTTLSTLLGLIVLVAIAYLMSQGIIPVPEELETVLTPPAAAPVSTAGPAPEGMPAWLNVYFTNPNADDPNTIDQHVVPVLNQAAQSIDIASFDFNLPSVVDAVVAASQRGVRVRVVVDEENGGLDLPAANSPTGKEYDARPILRDAGIEIVDGGRSNGLMHNKIIIVDGRTLFMGSWNMSFNDTNKNNNNVLAITDPTIIANYQAKFDEMYVDHLFGANAEVGARTPSFVAGGVQVENYFSPPDEVMDKLVGYVQGAQTSIHYMIFTYTHADLSSAMIAQAKAGLDVQGVIENRGASQGAMVPIYCAGLPVRQDGNPGTMHHKVIIIDGQTVITGSYNFTKSADDSNDDNILVIHSPAVAALYEQEWQKIYGQGKVPDPGDYSCN